MSGAAAPVSGDCTSPSDRCCQDPDRGQLPHSLLVVGASSGTSSSGGVQQDQYDSTDGDSIRATRNEQPVIGTSCSSGDCLPCMASGSQVTNPVGVTKEFQNEVLENFAREGDVSTISFSFETWCMSIARWCLKSRTVFGFFLSKTLCISRDGPPAHPTALFPLPMPFVRFAAGPEESKAASAHSRAIDRARVQGCFSPQQSY